jgi:hypothetical protein
VLGRRPAAAAAAQQHDQVGVGTAGGHPLQSACAPSGMTWAACGVTLLARAARCSPRRG